ncbi:DUF4127 family protein [Lentibacillus saliphilus]|uniref:DUF4127 family protein n=1 Tax=Lentibacillus saliphilus TaxID=2737028 RepID=UPI001C30A92C|nr:DUF4127 family protein [Lentibacillus saliphilus]
MTKTLALIPVDARPVTYDLPKDLAEIAGWNVLTPPKEKLGFLKTPADYSSLFNWLESIASQIDGLIVSMDMILYGGLVPSRVNRDDAETIAARLNRLRDIKKHYPDLKIMAFSSTMRLSNSYVNEEEKDYWNEYGKEIYTYSFHYHRLKTYGQKEDAEIVNDMMEKIPATILSDYLGTRKRHFNMNLSLIEQVTNGVIDLLIFPQDDTSEFGLNIMEQGQLKAEVAHNKLYDRIYIYPGADEVSSVLTARMIYTLEQEAFPTFYPIYSGLQGSLSIAMYEDRSIQESVKGQVFAFGGHTTETPTEADIILGVNVPGGQQGDLALQIKLNDVDTNNRNIGEWLRKLRYYYDKGKPLAVIDVAYANGADPAMIPQLNMLFSLTDLAGFAAWNTAGNTIGTVVAQSALVHLAKKQHLQTDDLKHKQLLLRLLDDYVYQSIVRKRVREDVDESTMTAERLLENVTEHFKAKADTILDKSGFRISHIYLPWDRTFEIGIELDATEK